MLPACNDLQVGVARDMGRTLGGDCMRLCEDRGERGLARGYGAAELTLYSFAGLTKQVNRAANQ